MLLCMIHTVHEVYLVQLPLQAAYLQTVTPPVCHICKWKDVRVETLINVAYVCAKRITFTAGQGGKMKNMKMPYGNLHRSIAFWSGTC